MLPEKTLKMAFVVMILLVSVYLWFSNSGETSAVQSELGGILGNFVPSSVNSSIAGLMLKSGLSEKGFCPFANPYMSALLSSGSLEAKNGTVMYKPFNHVYGGDTDCSWMKIIYDYEADKYNVCCDDDCKDFEVSELAEDINSYVATTDASFGLSLNQQIPNWQCFLFFGLLPFFTVSFFLRDILSFTLLSKRVKNLITVFASAIAIITGWFAKFVWQIAYLAKMSTGTTFFLLIFFMIIISVLMSWMGAFFSAFAAGKEEAGKVAAGLAVNATFQKIGQMQNRNRNP